MFTSFLPVFGSTLLTATGVDLQLVWRRGHVPWSEIAAVEAQRRSGRGGAWYVARLRTTSGKRHILRGMLGASSDVASNSFWADLELVRSEWERATGRTEPVQKFE
ncbi:PH domain-containing protein [Streptacidiphilus sp. EB129]|uniref:PH domain-containing protein n=1 Tax=Streptacidiphilus sp. EB129 TaxID=3156262 RepID=UPI003517D568